MIIGINESAYSVGRNSSDRQRTFQLWRNLGFFGWRPNATTFIDSSDPSKLICSQSEYEQQLVASAKQWLAIPGTEFVMPLLNNNPGVEFSVRTDQWKAFLDAETDATTGEVNIEKARTGLISCGLRVKHPGVLDFCKREMRRVVLSMFFGTRVTFEIGNADLDLFYTDWSNPTALDETGKRLCNALAPTTMPGNPRTNLIQLWQQAFSLWERWTRVWITNSSFVYFNNAQQLLVQPAIGSCDVVECGATYGNLPQAVQRAKFQQPRRVYLYSWTWAGYAWAGWKSDFGTLYVGSDQDGEGYANLCNREDEIRTALSF
jgi:hypothetical protein